VKNPMRTMLIIALLSEITSSGWTWIRAPSDTLRVGYEGSFVAYETERLIPWLITLGVSLLVCLLVDRKATRP